MTKKTLFALKGSIRKWEEIVNEKGQDNGSDNCPLCALFLPLSQLSCFGCPVREKTGERLCKKSPYTKWQEHHWNRHTIQFPLAQMRIYDDCPECKRLAQAELDFLKSLLPKETA